ncbi:hypothetical protein V6N12_010306, partial [Hibiscus sabdariffa]
QCLTLMSNRWLTQTTSSECSNSYTLVSATKVAWGSCLIISKKVGKKRKKETLGGIGKRVWWLRHCKIGDLFSLPFCIH